LISAVSWLTVRALGGSCDFLGGILEPNVM
jgi:hypothetical protein